MDVDAIWSLHWCVANCYQPFFLRVLVSHRCRRCCFRRRRRHHHRPRCIDSMTCSTFLSFWLSWHVLVVLIPIAVSLVMVVACCCDCLSQATCSIAKASYEPAMILHQLFYQNHSLQKHAMTLDSIQSDPPRLVWCPSFLGTPSRRKYPGS